MNIYGLKTLPHCGIMINYQLHKSNDGPYLYILNLSNTYIAF